MQREKIMRDEKRRKKIKTKWKLLIRQLLTLKAIVRCSGNGGTLKNYLYLQFLDFSPDWGVENFVRTCFRHRDELDENFC